jgi:hypothetical protein
MSGFPQAGQVCWPDFSVLKVARQFGQRASMSVP